jgi:hypothetical protein
MGSARPETGRPQEIAAGIRALADQEVSHLLIYSIPSNLVTIEALATDLEEVRPPLPNQLGARCSRGVKRGVGRPPSISGGAAQPRG